MKKHGEMRESWVADYVQGTASPSVMRSLEAELRTDAEFRAYFLEYLNIDLALSSEAACAAAQSGDSILELQKATRTRPWKIWGGIAAAIAFLILTGPWRPGARPPYATVCAATGAELRSGDGVRSASACGFFVEKSPPTFLPPRADSLS
jgi:ferric-dicitrate binding protein FerR (iron transport regulator)